MKADWSPLLAELAIWRRDGLVVPLWWRDDDAVAATPALERLSAVAGDLGLSVHVAVIPDLVEPSLAPVVLAQPELVPVVHGWRHVSHAPTGGKKGEFGHPRFEAEGELAQALARLTKIFGASLVPLFVPPWNRIDPALFETLGVLGYGGVSTYGARGSSALLQVNTHIDPIFWRGDRGLVAPEELIAGITDTLRRRRTGEVDASEPLGLLTHHLVHTEDVWRFSRDVLTVLLDGGAVPADIAGLVQAGRKPSI